MMKTKKLLPADNLQQLGAIAASSKRPVLLIFTQHHCDFCHTLKEEILNPMLLSEKERSRVMMRELSIDPGESFTDFNGQTIDGFELFNRYKLIVTPSIILLDENGELLGEPLVGVNTIEMYGWYLNIAIDDARRKLLTR